MADNVRYDVGGWLSGSMISEDRILRQLQERFPDYQIGREVGRARYFAYGSLGCHPHTLITDDLGELAAELALQAESRGTE